MFCLYCGCSNMLSSNICASCGYAVPAPAFPQGRAATLSRRQVGKVKTILFVCLGLVVLGMAAISYTNTELPGPAAPNHATLRR